jgi:hypothetical protein
MSFWLAVELSLLSFDTAGKRCATLPACISLTLSLIRPKPPKTSKTKNFFLFLLFYIGCDRTRRIRCCCAALSYYGRQMRSQLPSTGQHKKKTPDRPEKNFSCFWVLEPQTKRQRTRHDARRAAQCLCDTCSLHEFNSHVAHPSKKTKKFFLLVLLFALRFPWVQPKSAQPFMCSAA